MFSVNVSPLLPSPQGAQVSLAGLARLAERSQMAGSPFGHGLEFDAAGIRSRLPDRYPILARIGSLSGSASSQTQVGSGSGSGSGGLCRVPHPWVELQDDVSGCTEDLPGGLYGDADYLPAYETNGQVAPAGTVVLLFRGRGDFFWFTLGGSGTGSGTGSGFTNCVDVVTDVRCVSVPSGSTSGSASGGEETVLEITRAAIYGPFTLSSGPCDGSGSNSNSGTG